MTRSLAFALITLALALPAAAQRKPVAKPAPKPAVKKPAKPTRAQLIDRTKKLLTQASAASKGAAVKKEIATSLALLDRKQFKPAMDRVSELKRTAALGGESATVVTRLVDAENLLDSLQERVEKRKTGKR